MTANTKENDAPAPACPVDIRRLPRPADRGLFGRDAELAQLDKHWANKDIRVFSVVALGGAGKSALVAAWLKQMARDNWRGAECVYGWSFYSQGSSDSASSDIFVETALRWLGYRGEIPTSPWDRGALLAGWVKKQRTLLVLDGLEPLQAPPGPEGGKLRDPAMEVLLGDLAVGNRGLCVISTRYPVLGLGLHEDAEAPRLDLDKLRPEDGAALLNVLGARGEDKELRRASEEVKGHALALNLLGSYVADVCEGDIRGRDTIGPLEGDISGGDHAKRVMGAYTNWLGRREVKVLRLLGLFNRPADRGCVDALRAEPGIAELTLELVGLYEKEWKQVLANLKRARLVEEVKETGELDAHPLVREYFGERLREETPEAWRAGHGRLFEHLRKVAKPLPENSAEMAPLYAAVVHGCRAGRAQEALDEVLWKRIYRGEEVFNVHKLGAFGEDLGMLAAFFQSPWTRLEPGLSEAAEAMVLGNTGFTLRALGRLEEAAEPMQGGLEKRIAQQNWENAARAVHNLSELYLLQGNVAKALETARQGVKLADRSEGQFQRIVNRTMLANALRQAGEEKEALALFEQAELLQKEFQPDMPFLYSLRGFQYRDLLLDLGQIESVLQRARYALSIAHGERWLLDIALDQLSLGRALLHQALRDPQPNLGPAQAKLKEALEALYRAGMQEFLPLGFLALAEVHLAQPDLPSAERCLQQALRLATRSGMRLFECDARLGLTRLYLDRADRQGARKSLSRAEELIQACGYSRRAAQAQALRERLVALGGDCT